MTWPEFREAVAENRIAVIPAGIIEQHGPHLPLDTDIFLAQEITTRAAARIRDKVVIVPPILHGHSPHHMDFPGTLNVDPVNLLNAVIDICMSLAHHGFKKILIVNGHGSNMPVLDLAARQTILKSEGKAACAPIFYMLTQEFEDAARRLFPDMAGVGGHGDDIETSLYMALRPDLVQLDKAEDDLPEWIGQLGSAPLPLRLHWSAISKEGIYGKVKNSDKAKGEELLEAAIEGVKNIMLELYEREIPPRVDHH